MAVEQTWALQNASVNAITSRQAYGTLVPAAGAVMWNGGTNPSGELAVTQQGTPNMSVLVAAGRCWMPGNFVSNLTGFDWSTQGPYFALNDAALTATIAASDPTNPRWDAVYMGTRDAFYTGANNDTIIGVVTGTPAPSPGLPAIPSNAVLLAYVNVLANATTITNSNISDQRSLYNSGMAVAQQRQTGNQSIPNNAFTALTWNATDIDTRGAVSGNVFTAPQAGYYQVSGCATFVANATGRRLGQYWLNGSLASGTNQVNFEGFSASANGPSVIFPATLVHATAAGQTIGLAVYQDSGGAINASQCTLTIRQVLAR